MFFTSFTGCYPYASIYDEAEKLTVRKPLMLKIVRRIMGLAGEFSGRLKDPSVLSIFEGFTILSPGS
jgi:hypothetical protein